MLKIENISLTFHAGTPGEVRAIRNVSLGVDPGHFVCILGTNGSGKSTLLSMIAGNLPVDSGLISLNGRDLTGIPEHRRAAFIGRVFQNPFSGTAPSMSIAENIALAAGRGGRRGLKPLLDRMILAEIRERIAGLKMGMEDRLFSPIGKLSGGQRQALTLLMATWKRPSLLLLDEHTAALDPKTAARIIQLTREIISEQQLTTLMVTHSMEQAADLGNRLIMMHAGTVVHDFHAGEKKHLRPADLNGLFSEVRRKERIDPSMAGMLQRMYI